MNMEKAKVYFTDFRTPYGGASLPQKLQKLMKKAGIEYAAQQIQDRLLLVRQAASGELQRRALDVVQYRHIRLRGFLRRRRRSCRSPRWR